jgi:regulator of replication initiation timing
MSDIVDRLEVQAEHGLFDLPEGHEVVGWQIAADEIKRLEAENKRLREALHEWDALIRHQYSGSREAMSDMVEAAQNTAQLLYGDPPWPEPTAIKGDSDGT